MKLLNPAFGPLAGFYLRLSAFEPSLPTSLPLKGVLKGVPKGERRQLFPFSFREKGQG